MGKKLVKNMVEDFLDALKKNAPIQIPAGLLKAKTWLDGSTAQVTEAFSRVYASTSTRVAAWLPTKATMLVASTLKFVDWAKVKVDKA